MFLHLCGTYISISIYIHVSFSVYTICVATHMYTRIMYIQLLTTSISMISVLFTSVGLDNHMHTCSTM